jgi:hypothetical protein
LGGRKGKGWRVQLSLDIGGLYLPLGGLSLPLHLEVVATFGIITSLEQKLLIISHILCMVYCGVLV